MTTQKLLDWFAEREGFTKKRVDNHTGLGSSYYYAWFDKNGRPDGTFFNNHRAHPFPSTLDTAAMLFAKYLPGWTWARWGDGVWITQPPGTNPRLVEVPDTGDELHDRLALVYAALNAVQP